MAELTLVQAVNAALARAMEEDERVLVLGEDVGVDGGVFRATDGLLDRFGPTRVFDTPLAETVIAGASIGLAAQGFRPVAEIQFMGFIYSTLDQMISHAARTPLANPWPADVPRWCSGPLSVAASGRSSITPRAPRRCSRRCPVCAW